MRSRTTDRYHMIDHGDGRVTVVSSNHMDSFERRTVFAQPWEVNGYFTMGNDDDLEYELSRLMTSAEDAAKRHVFGDN